MKALVRALQDERPGIPVPWGPLARELRPVPGTLTILLGRPGALKSMLSLAWATHLAKLGMPAHLISLDTDSKTQAARLIAHLRGDVTTGEVMQDPHPYIDWLQEKVDLPLRLTDTPVSVDDIDEIVQADEEYFGRKPALVVIDDVSKLVMETRDYQGFDTTMLELHRLARRHDLVVLALHHLSRGARGERTDPVKLADGKYTGEYEAEIVLGAWRPTDFELIVGVLKNRYGTDNPLGDHNVVLAADPARVQITLPSARDWAVHRLTPQERYKR